MDVNDVSDASPDNVQQAAEHADRPADPVLDHPHPERLIRRHEKLSERNVNSRPVSLPVPTPYDPCIRAISDLSPIMISKMTLETHHRGNRALLHVITSPRREDAIVAVVEDQRGTAISLHLHHQPEESLVPAQEIMPRHGVCIVKEPFFTRHTDGSYILRVDHLRNVVWLAAEDIPSPWRRIVPLNSSESIRHLGNDAVGERRWAEAQRLYSGAILAAETPDERQLAHLNRSLTNLKLGRLERALGDATQAMPSEMRLFREARTLYATGDFEKCLERLQSLSTLDPENKAAKTETDRVKVRLREQAGKYSFRRMYKEADLTLLIDCATFSSLVEVRPSGRGQGLFSTAPVSAGQLLLCEKAFAYKSAETDRAVQIYQGSWKTRVGKPALVTQIVQKLYHNPEHVQLFCNLYGESLMPSEVDGYPIVNTFLVDRIVSLYSLGAPRSSRAELKRAHMRRYTACGFWLLGSRINHSCIGNCLRSFIGDMQIVRATKDLPAGTELFTAYEQPAPKDSYEEAQKKLNHWGLTCACRLCEDRKATHNTVLQKRQSLFLDLSKAMEWDQTSKAQRILKKLEETYAPNAIRMELWGSYWRLGGMLAKQPVNAIRVIVKGFEALGYDITAWQGEGKKEFEINNWGLVNSQTVSAFMHLRRAYRKLAPELCPMVRRHLEAARSMVVGEKDTISEDFPELQYGA